MEVENVDVDSVEPYENNPRKKKHPPLTFNTRVYSCNLIRNDLEYRWRGRYNEDTILRLDLLKAGYATVIFNTLLQGKKPTQTFEGGNSSAFYFEEGTYPKSKLLEEAHPDVVEVTRKFHRWHHEANYKPFADNPLKRKPNEEVPESAMKQYELDLGDRRTN